MNICRCVSMNHNIFKVSARSLFTCQSWLSSLSVPIKPRTNLQSLIHASRNLHIEKGSQKKFTANHKRDNIPPDYSVIYQSSIGPWFLMFRIGMGTMCACMGVVYGMLLPDMAKESFLSYQALFLAGVGGFMVLFLSVFSIAARQFLTRIYYHSDSGQFIGVQRSLFGRLKQLRYVPEDVQFNPSKSKSKKSPQEWESVNVIISGKKVYLQSREFISPIYYNMHIGASSNLSRFTVQEPKF